MSEMKRTVNALPSKTWYWLKMNDAVLPWEEEGGSEIIQIENKNAPVFLQVSGGNYEKKQIEISAKEKEEVEVYMQYADFSHLEALTKIHVGKGSRVKLVQVMKTGKETSLINRIETKVEEEGSLELYQVMLGQGNIYGETLTDLVGKEASFDADLGYLVQDEELLDINMVVNHFGEETRSRIKADGALKDMAKKVFRGTIDFKKGSVGAEGEETETVLMLGDDVQNQTIPVILCSEETVAGSHGATIGELDEDTLFYFESRGIGKKEAEDIMARAAIDRIGRLLSEEKAQEWIQDGLKEVLS